MARPFSLVWPKLSTGSKVGLSVFFVVWTLGAAFLAGFLVWQAIRTLRAFSWQPTPCVILESRVIEPQTGSDSYSVAIRYRYAWGDRQYTSEQVTSSGKSWSDYRSAARFAARYPPNSQATCYVNPKAPAEAVLERERPWIALLGLIPLGFAAVGVVALWGIWRQPRQAEGVPEPISARAHGAREWGCMAAFFSVFLLAGLGFSYVVFVRPVAQVLAARNWRETPCVILSSRVRTHSGSDGATYSVQVLYSYVIDGMEYRSSRYSFMGGSSSGYESKAAVVRRYAPGTCTVCYVNPADPTDAVLVREFTGEMWLGLIPLAFVAVGAVGLVWALRQRTPKVAKPARPEAAALASAWPGGVGARTRTPTGPVVLRSTGSRLGKFVGSVLIAAFWNGILSVFIGEVVRSFQRGRPEWGLTVFMIPFVLVGLILVGYVGYSFLLLFAPGVKLRLSAGAVPLGGSADLEWEITGRATALRKLRLWLEGREEATRHQGKRTATERATFATLELAAPTLWTDIRYGQVRFSVPADAMHSFKATHNRITWVLRVHGDIAFYPDVDDEFPFTVLPWPPGQPAAA